jgi:heterodisulfide reductase subunit A
MLDAGRHPNIELLDYSEVAEVQGYVGNFDVRVRRMPRYVKRDLCTGCRECEAACVLRGGKGRLMVPSEFDAGMGKRPAVYVPFAQAVPLKAVIDPDSCLWLLKGKCSLRCVDVCEAGAIDLEMQETFVDLKVGCIVVATGFSMWDAAKLPEYGYGKSPNILTGLEFERLTAAGGPTAGEIRTAEGRKPERVAIIHCVGSRDERAHAYCSRFCCMYSLKQAHQIKEKTEAEVFSIYMDMRTFGKDYEEFYTRTRREGIQFIQGRPSQVTVDPASGEIFVEVEDILLGRVMELRVDMVVLATAVEPPADADRIASTFRLGRTPDGWFAEAHPKLRPVETATAGVYLAGCAQGPRDVPDTVAHATAAAAEAVRLCNQGEVTISPTVAVVEPERCVGCGECIATCPYSAIVRGDTEKAEVNPALCQGCGTCAATCPSGAITALHFTDEEIVVQIDGLLEPCPGPVGEPAAQGAGSTDE